MNEIKAIIDAIGDLGRRIRRLESAGSSDIPCIVVYNAARDGIADDSGAINDAIVLCNSLGGGYVMLPGGRYRITVPINMMQNVRFTGEGRKRSVLVPSEEGFPAISFTDTITHWEVSHIGIDFSVATGSARSTNVDTIGIRLSGSIPYFFTLEDIEIEYAYRGLEDVSQAFMGSLKSFYVKNVGNCGIYKNPAAGSATTFILENCYVDGSDQDGVIIYNVHALEITASAADHCDSMALQLVSCQGAINGWDTEGCSISNSQIIWFSNSRVTVSGLYMYGNDLGGGVSYGVRITDASFVTFISCLTEVNTYSGGGLYFMVYTDTACNSVNIGSTFDAPTGMGGTSWGYYIYLNNVVVVDSARFRNTQMLNMGSAGSLTISGGIITVTKSYHRVDTEGAAASDDLATINGGVDGDLLILSAADSARTVVIKHGTGNIRLNGSADFSLDHDQDRIMLLYDGGIGLWISVGPGSNNG